MLHPTDRDDFERITGTNQIPADFEAEYMVQLRMQHRMKHDGPLGVLMVPLCRQFGLKCPDELRLSGTATNWGQVPRGSRVRVTMDGGGVARGTFQQRNGYGLDIQIEGMPYVQEFPPIKVSLDEAVPADLKLPEAAKTAMQQQVSDASLDYAASNTDVEESLPRLNSIQGPDQRPSARMDDPRWKSLKPGQKFKVNQDGQEVDAKFVRIFGTRQVVAEINGDEDLVDESNCILPEVKQPKKTRAPRKKKAVLA